MIEHLLCRFKGLGFKDPYWKAEGRGGGRERERDIGVVQYKSASCVQAESLYKNNNNAIISILNMILFSVNQIS